MGKADDEFEREKLWKQWFEEASTHFEPEHAEPVSIETLHALHQTVLLRANYHCVLTGKDLSAAKHHLHAVPIQPHGAGGALHIDNFLCLCSDAEHAFSRGHLTIGPQLELVVDLSRIDPEFFEQLNPIGRLLVNAAGSAPDPLALHFHRSQVFLSEG